MVLLPVRAKARATAKRVPAFAGTTLREFAGAKRFGRSLALWLLALPALAAPPAATTDFDAVFDAAKARYHLPGLAIGVIEDGKIVYARADGERVAGTGQQVTPDTLFKIASNTKAMTVGVLARLVDAGKLRWDDPVVEHLPQFRMYEPWVTREMQVRDLLIHNSGLPEGAGDLMLWPEPNRFTRGDIIAGLAHLKPERSFRSGYAYDNLLYVVAGEVAAAAGGAPYEELVRREVFEPLGLSRCRVGEFDRREVGNVAQPHWYVDGRHVVVGADPQVVPAITSAAAGGIRCSLDDMLTWAMNWLAPTPAQLEWLSPAQREAIWTAHTPMPVSQHRRDWDDTHLYAYGYGFRLADIDGEWSVSHTGTLSGMYSLMHLLPDRRSGFVVLMNGSSGPARTVLNRVLLDHFLKPQRQRSVAWYADALQARESAPASASPVPDTSARQPARAEALGERLGIYRDPWFGRISLCERDGAVHFASAKSPELAGQLMRVGDRHLIDWTADSVDVEAWLDFHDAPGRPAITMAKTDPEADFSYDYEDLAFARVGDCPQE